MDEADAEVSMTATLVRHPSHKPTSSKEKAGRSAIILVAGSETRTRRLKSGDLHKLESRTLALGDTFPIDF